MARQPECSKCGRLKENQDASYCDTCRATYRKQHYEANKPIYFLKAKAQRKRLKERVNELKSAPCADCKKRWKPWQMSFDHLPGKKKVLAVARLLVFKGLRGVLAEIKKCDLVCLNCHADRTYRRQQQAEKQTRVSPSG